jgi:hypothetical protein
MGTKLNIRRLGGRGIAVVAAAAALSIAAGIAYAAIPSADGTITSCYDATGTLKVIDAAAACPAGSTRLTFNQKGQGYQTKGLYDVSTDRANGYNVGDVVRCNSSNANQKQSGSYVKTVKKAGGVEDITGYCNGPGGWQSLAYDGPVGAAGPDNVSWARVKGDGTITARKGNLTGYDAGTGAVWINAPGIDVRRCAVTASSSDRDGNVVASYRDYGYAEWVYLETRRNGVLVDASFDVTVNC